MSDKERSRRSRIVGDVFDKLADAHPGISEVESAEQIAHYVELSLGSIRKWYGTRNYRPVSRRRVPRLSTCELLEDLIQDCDALLVGRADGMAIRVRNKTEAKVEEPELYLRIVNFILEQMSLEQLLSVSGRVLELVQQRTQ